MANESLCASCSNSIRCDTWTEWRCSTKKRRIYETVTKCSDYAKRPKNFKQMRCHCKDCLENESLIEQLEEEQEV